jgi:hypothetical protein
MALEGSQYFIKAFPFRFTFIGVINLRQEQKKNDDEGGSVYL